MNATEEMKADVLVDSDAEDLAEIGEVKADTKGNPFGWFVDGGAGGRTFV